MSSTPGAEQNAVKKRRHRKHAISSTAGSTGSMSQTTDIPVIDISQNNADIQLNTNEIENGFFDVSNMTRKKSGFFVGKVDEDLHFVPNKNNDTKSQGSNTFEDFMKNKEENFKANYVKIVKKDEDNAELDLKKISSNVFSNIKKDIRERENQTFDINSCDFNSTTIGNPLFQPSMNGISNVFLKNSEDLLNDLNGKKVRTEMSKMKTALNANYLTITESQPCEEINYCREIYKLFESCRQEISDNEYIINLSHPDAQKLISLIAKFFVTGLRMHPNKMLDDILSYMTSTNSDASLQSSIYRAKRIDDKKSPFNFFVDFVLNLLEDSQCSSLLKYLNDNIQLKSKYYYVSSPILNPALSNIFAICVEKIDISELNGFFMSESLTLPPFPADKISDFITGSINEYLDETRKWILKGVDYKTNQLEPLSQILILFMNILLTNSDGKISPLSSLWDLYEAIAKTNSQHPMFSKFCKILKSEEVNHGFNQIPKAIRATVFALNEDLLPYILLFSNGVVKTRSVPSPYYLNNLESCVKISYALLPLANPLFHVKYDSIKSHLN